MFLMFTLARPDVMPATDYGVQQGYARLYGLDALPKPADLLTRTQTWAPYRTTGAWYLWRVLEFESWPPPNPA
jgi:DNA-3-methyladenine glycosylase II